MGMLGVIKRYITNFGWKAWSGHLGELNIAGNNINLNLSEIYWECEVGWMGSG